MNNSLAIYDNFDQMQRAAMALHESGYFSDSNSKAKAIVKVMAGAELGIPPFASMTGIHIIQGKPALGANVIAILIKNDPRYNYKLLELTEDICRIEFYEDGQPCGVSEFTAADAQKAGTKNMNKFPKNMLFARNISNGAKWYTPGIFGGAPVYTPEELGADVDEDGNVIYGEATRQLTTVIQPSEIRNAAKDDYEQHITYVEDGLFDEPETAVPASSSVADVRSGFDELKTFTLGIVADRAVMTGFYDNTHHALNAMKGYDFPDGVEIKFAQKVSKKGALQVFDWLMERKEAEEAEA